MYASHPMWIAQLILLTAALAKQEDDVCWQDTDGLVALIPARSGSKEIKNKNLATIGNSTLIERALRITLASKVFSEVWVSTDGAAIAEKARSAGANVHMRHPDTASDSAPTIFAVQEFIQKYPGINYVAVIQCTSPFICPAWLIQAATYLIQGADCVFAVTTSHKLRWKRNSDGFVTAANFNSSLRPRRQDWSGDLIETGMFYMAKRSLIEEGILQNNRCRVVEVPAQRALEIDNLIDLHIARSLLHILPSC